MFEKLFYFLYKPYSTGAIKNPVDPRNIALASFQKPVALPTKYNFELGEVENQGSVPKCVGSAIGKLASKKLGVDLSSDDLYNQCKAVDGIPTIAGTYPAVGAKIITNNGVSSKEVYSTKDEEKIKKSRESNKLGGYAFVTNTYEAICQAIYQNEGVTASFLVDYNWYKGIIMKVLSTIGGHYVILTGFDTSKLIFFGRNSWGSTWIGYIAGIFNRDVKAGDFQMQWLDYKDNIRDVISFTTIPEDIKEEAKKYDYRFTTFMKRGSTGYEVKKLQERLGITQDGKFGKITEKYVKFFQSSNGLIADGKVGSKTRAVLNKNVKSMIDLWAMAIQLHEGYFVGSRSYRNNSPANFKLSRNVLTSYMKSLGANGLDKDNFVKFPTYEIGFKALCTFLTDACNDKLGWYRSTMTLLDFFNVYAPPFENDTNRYAVVVAEKLGVPTSTIIKDLL